MSEICSYCGVCSRHACSSYRREYLHEELSKCPNLHDDSRLSALEQAGVATESDRSVQELHQRIRELEAEIQSIKKTK